MADFEYSPILPVSGHDVSWRRLSVGDGGGVRVRRGGGLGDVLEVAPEVLTALASAAYQDVSHLLRPAHLAQLRRILDDPSASANDRYVALELLRNAVVSSGGVLPMCQDTGTAIVVAERGHRVWTDGRDAEHLSRGVFDTYRRLNLRYSQMAPVSLWDEVNTGTNLPAQIDISLGRGLAYEFLFLAKGGGSANKTFLYQESKAVLEHDRMLAFLREKIASLGTAACPPYHLAVVIGGTSAEANLKAAKLASAHFLDGLPLRGGPLGHGFRDAGFEAELHRMTEDLGFGAQFGGKYFCHDVRVVRLPRHGGSLPISISVSCSADRQILGRIDPDGVFLESLETDPARFLPDVDAASLGGSGSGAVRHIDLDQPMPAILAALDDCPVSTRLSLTGPLIVARDIAHARIRAQLDAGGAMPDYLRDHPVYYAGPAKKPDGLASGSFGPTTAGRMDSYVDQFQAAGGSLVMLAKGNRSAAVTRSCQRHGGFYLGSVGGPAARLAQDCIRSVDVIDFPELGMEAVFRIEVVDFPAFVVVDNKGNDFFAPSTSTLVGLGPTRTAGP